MKNNHVKFVVIVVLVWLVPAIIFTFEFPKIPYQGKTLEIVTDHFVVIFPEKYTAVAKKAATYAEDIHDKLAPEMNWYPFEKTNVIITPHTDFPNGMGLPFIRNTIYLFVSQSDLSASLRNFEDPLYSVILHEYTHILHLDQIRGAAYFWRVLYGKLYLPLSGSFLWYMEGTAVLKETLHAGGGRLDSPYSRAIIRSAAKNKQIPSYDTVIYDVADWPNNTAVYYYGAEFVEYLYMTYGKEKFDAFMKDISDDFWPFILMFVLKFKKIYGKSLDVLWDEWREHEERKAELEALEEPPGAQLTDLQGNVLALSKKDDMMLISSSSYSHDNYIYLLKDDRLKKIHRGYHRSVSFTGDDDIIMYTRSVEYADDFHFFDLYSYNLKTGVEKKLTKKGRVNYACFSPDSSLGVYVSHDVESSRLFITHLSGDRLADTEEAVLPSSIKFIDQPALHEADTKVAFGVRLINNERKLIIYDIGKAEVTVFDQNAQSVCWLDDNTVGFIAPEGPANGVFSLDIATGMVKKHLVTDTFLVNAVIDDGSIYYVNYTHSGEELFETALTEWEDFEEQAVTESLLADDGEGTSLIGDDTEDVSIKRYTGIRNFLPTAWAFLPFQLSTSAFYRLPTGIIAVPMYGPQFMVYNSLPLGRVSYTATIALDYMKMFPENSFNLTLKLPYVDVSYDWHNWAGGEKFYLDNVLYEAKYNTIFPINFSNSLSLYYSYPLPRFGYFFWSFNVSHFYNQYDFISQKPNNRISFYERVGFYAINKRNKSSRWDRGVVLSLTCFQYPHNVVDNVPLYAVRTTAQARAPFANMHLFTTIEAGTELTFKNVFTATSELFKFANGILEVDGSASGLLSVNTKAFPAELINISFGSAFAAADLGLNISVYKKTHYAHFATIGFKELYFNIYSEFVYLHNMNNQYFIRGILFDQVLELGLDLFVAYGNINASFVFGGAVGYRMLDVLPAWSVFCYMSVFI